VNPGIKVLSLKFFENFERKKLNILLKLKFFLIKIYSFKKNRNRKSTINGGIRAVFLVVVELDG